MIGIGAILPANHLAPVTNKSKNNNQNEQKKPQNNENQQNCSNTRLSSRIIDFNKNSQNCHSMPLAAVTCTGIWCTGLREQNDITVATSV